MLERTPKTCYDLSEPDFQDAVRLSSDLLEDPTTRSRLVSGSRIGLAIEFDTVGLFFSPTITTGIIRALYYTAIHSANF